MRRVLAALLLVLSTSAFAQNPGVTVQGAVTPGHCVKFVNRNLIADNGAACASASSGANPTATISTTAVNGIATTFMRSDAAPALASTIVAGGPTGSSSVIPVITWNAAGQLTAVTTASISVPVAANPTASVGLTAVNGSAATFMRSDGAPALDVTIAPTWTGLHTFSPSAALGAGSTASFVKITGTWNDAGTTFNGGFLLNFTATAANASSLLFDFQKSGVSQLKQNLNGTLTSVGNIISSGGSLRVGSDTGVFSLGASSDIILSWSAAAKLQLGAANAASPVAQTLQAQGSRAGTDTNVAGANLTIASGQGTGNSTGSSLIFQTPLAVASGTGAQTMTTQLTLGLSTAAFVGSISTGGNVSVPSGNTFKFSGRAALFSQADSSFSFNNNSGSIIFNFSSPVSDTLQFGLANAASPVAQIVQSQGSRSGTDSNVGGANLTVTSGNGTGTGAISSLILQSPIAVAGGSGAQTMTTGLTINKGVAATTGYAVANLPATPLTGSRAHVTDQLTTCAGVGVALTGGGAVVCPAFYNGVAWVGG